MGEATYYLKARFRNAEAAELALEPVRAFLAEVGRAQAWWQKHRHLAEAEFWPEFRKLFPATTKYLGTLAKGDCNNGLAGEMSFGDEPDNIGVVDDELRYSEYTWHLASWGRLCEYLENEFGAVKAAYVSDEYADVFSCVDMD